jgi:hypothetical protein
MCTQLIPKDLQWSHSAWRNALTVFDEIHGRSLWVGYLLFTKDFVQVCFSREREREREREVCSNSCCQKMIARQSVWKLNESLLGGLSYMEGNTGGVWHSSNEQVSKPNGLLIQEHRTPRVLP